MLAIIKFILGWSITTVVFVLCFIYRLIIWDWQTTEAGESSVVNFIQENLGEKTYRVMFFKSQE